MMISSPLIIIGILLHIMSNTFNCICYVPCNNYNLFNTIVTLHNLIKGDSISFTFLQYISAISETSSGNTQAATHTRARARVCVCVYIKLSNVIWNYSNNFV